ncbi:heterokaryon incompatibility protein-domain-containing protein [Echria macrotheca]|uniref:Heterokaryon incompatibility protein-domain-containing protein n=1 Tax=Echria macrotheca TaxID=438768 RepID=A0AAJ0F1G1_9PEZI|nr:heterokaryon incompatibility protein-domain-containing protein [Echria macrotheca]
MDAQSQPFQYGPLDLDRPAFRLLRILKGRGWVVSCELFSAYLTEGNERQEAISYEALSYVWGTTERGLKYIEVNGRQFQITNNLHEALQRLRLEDEDRIIWVDAVCIDQDNEKERGHQVRHMGDIYKKADRVLYWLGLSTYETEFCLGALKTLQEASRSVAHSQWTLVRWANFWQSLDTGYCNRPSLQREGLRILCDRPWFRRVWILQEVAKSRAAEVYCGKSSVSARMFSLAPFLMGFQPGTHVQAIFDMMPGPFRKDSWFGKNTGLYTLLMNFGGAEAKDSRDLVYALLGMSSDGINDILPDYGRSEEDLMKILAHYFFHVDLDLFPASNMPSTMREFCTRLPEMSKVALEIAAGMEKSEVESKNIYGETPLHLAAKMGWTNVASVLLDPGRAQVDSRDNGLYTPLMRALFDGHEEVADALVTRFQADVNARSGFGETPLFAAVESGMQSAVELLIRYHANVRYSTERGKTALCKQQQGGGQIKSAILIKLRWG